MCDIEIKLWKVLYENLGTGKRIGLENIPFATDFSPFPNAALPYALAIARQRSKRNSCQRHSDSTREGVAATSLHG
jgi:hypothetical protein